MLACCPLYLLMHALLMTSSHSEGRLPELIDIVVESGATLFISAVGVPPIWAVEKLHQVSDRCSKPMHACSLGPILLRGNRCEAAYSHQCPPNAAWLEAVAG